MPFVLLAHPALPANNAKELVALALARPGQLNYASSGNGGSPHLAMELFKMTTGTNIVHVPYKGGAPAISDLLGGQVQMMFSTVVQGLPHVKAGKLKILAVGDPKRIAALPDVPTIAESGAPGFDISTWFGVLAPGATPRPLITRLNKEILQVLGNAELKAKFASEGAEAVGSSPAEFEQLLRTEIDKYVRIVKAADVRVN